MDILKVSVIGFLLSALAACSSNSHMYTKDGKCLTCWNNPITGKPVNHGEADEQQDAKQDTSEVADKPSSTNKVEGEFKEYAFTFLYQSDVDVAYLKLKKEFGYKSEQEIRQEWGSLADTKLQSFSEAYDATPGVYYHMRSHLPHENTKAIIDTLIEKDSRSQVRITVKYWLNNPKIDARSFGNSLQNRMMDAIGS